MSEQNVHETADYSALLAKHEEPTVGGRKVPYQLWGRVIPIGKEGKPGPDICELRMVGSHIHPEKAELFLSFGWKLLKYWIPDPKVSNDGVITDDFAPARNLLASILKGSYSNDLLKELEAERAKNQVLENKVKEKAK